MSHVSKAAFVIVAIFSGFSAHAKTLSHDTSVLASIFLNKQDATFQKCIQDFQNLSFGVEIDKGKVQITGANNDEQSITYEIHGVPKNSKSKYILFSVTNEEGTISCNVTEN